MRTDRLGAEYADPESTDTGDAEGSTAFVAPRSANVDPESQDTGETEGDSPSNDSRPDPFGDSTGVRPAAH